MSDPTPLETRANSRWLEDWMLAVWRESRRLRKAIFVSVVVVAISLFLPPLAAVVAVGVNIVLVWCAVIVTVCAVQAVHALRAIAANGGTLPPPPAPAAAPTSAANPG